MTLPPSPKQRRGFALLSPERRIEIAAKGGHAVPPSKRSFTRNRELAASAGRKGGEAFRKTLPTEHDE